jgi:tetratricopeptide (TPR) repeat protein
MAWLCAMVATTLALASPAADEFERGKTAFGRAEYTRAIDILRPLLYPDIRLDSEGDVVQAHRILGVAYLFEKQPDEAKREFHKLLELRPDYHFDPLLDPPRVVEFFNGVRREEEREISALEVARKKRDADLAARRQQEADARCAAQARLVIQKNNSYAVNYVPFGAGQFQNGERGKGWAFFGVEAALGAVSLGAFMTNFALFGASHQRRCLDPATSGDTTGMARNCMNIDHSEEDLSRNLLRLQLVSGGLFFVTAAWGIIDALQSFKPAVSTETEPAHNGAATSPGTAGAAARLRVGPLPIPRGSGLGVAWTF